MNKELILRIIDNHNLKLSESSIKRLIELAEVKANWDGLNAKTMNEESCQQMLYFLEKVNDKIPNDIGFFFDDEGILSMNWLLNNNLIEIYFKTEAIYLYIEGYEDGIAMPPSLLKNFNYQNPEIFFIKYKNKLEAASKILHKLHKDVAENLLDLITYDYGWGEHGDESEINNDALDSLIKFVDHLDILSKNIIIFITPEGFIEMILMDYNPRHEIEFTPVGLVFFLAPEYDITTIDKNKFNKYKDINHFLIGEIK